MKIIAKVSDGEFIVTADSCELAKIAGFSSPYSYYSKDGQEISVGRKIEVHQMYEHLEKLEKVNSKLCEEAKNLHCIAQLLELKAPQIEGLLAKKDGE